MTMEWTTPPGGIPWLDAVPTIRTADAEQAKCELCDRPVQARELCNAHYKSERKAGRLPLATRPRGLTLVDAFAWYMPGDPPESDCWDWQGGTFDEDGYGKFGWGQSNMYAHRASYEIFCGAIPEGLLVRHTCDRPICVQPVHLVVGTNDDNMADMVERERAVRGTEHHNAVLNPDKVREIRRRVEGGESIRSVGRGMDVSQTAVHRIIRGDTWSHVD